MFLGVFELSSQNKENNNTRLVPRSTFETSIGFGSAPTSAYVKAFSSNSGTSSSLLRQPLIQNRNLQNLQLPEQIKQPLGYLISPSLFRTKRTNTTPLNTKIQNKKPKYAANSDASDQHRPHTEAISTVSVIPSRSFFFNPLSQTSPPDTERFKNNFFFITNEIECWDTVRWRTKFQYDLYTDTFNIYLSDYHDAMKLKNIWSSFCKVENKKQDYYSLCQEQCIDGMFYVFKIGVPEKINFFFNVCSEAFIKGKHQYESFYHQKLQSQVIAPNFLQQFVCLAIIKHFTYQINFKKGKKFPAENLKFNVWMDKNDGICIQIEDKTILRGFSDIEKYLQYSKCNLLPRNVRSLAANYCFTQSYLSYAEEEKQDKKLY